MANVRKGIVDFYKDKNILITGTTGLMGTSLVEKLVRSFPQVNKIYLLVRKKKTESVEERCRKYLDKKIFSRVKLMNPNYYSKIVWIDGDLTASKNLGLSTMDLNIIKDNINIVFHCAASLNFAESLRQILLKNLRATQDLLNICKDGQNVDSFVYISTLYSNTKKGRYHIMDKLYPPFVEPLKLLQMVGSLTDKEFQEKSKSLNPDCPNFYTFSKNISENLVNLYKTDFPVGIVRPGIIVGSAYEPFPYWVQGQMALERILLEIDRGFLFKTNPKARSGAVPVDMLTNATIAAAYDIYNHKNETRTYNFSANSNPCTYQDINSYYVNGIDKFELLRKRLKYNYILPLKYIFNSSSKDVISRKKFDFFYTLMDHFFNTEYIFENTNVQHLWDSLSQEERKLLFFNVDDINWKSFYEGMAKGRVQDDY